VEQFKWQKKERDQILPTMLAGLRLFIMGDDQSLSELRSGERKYSFVQEGNGWKCEIAEFLSQHQGFEYK
jgi:hypothetical protein